MMGSAWLSLFLLTAHPAVTSASDCPSGRDIESKLSALMPERTALPGTVAVRPTTDGLLVDLQPENSAFAAQRSVVVGSNCEQRAEAAAVIIATWWPTERAMPRQVTSVNAQRRLADDPDRFSVATGGYASMVSGSVTPGVRAEASLSLWRRGFGVRMAAGATLSHENTLGEGKASWSRASLELGPTYALGFVRADAGLVGSFLWVGGSGFPENHNESGTAVGFTLGVQAAARWGRVQPWLELRGLAWPQTQKMYVNNAATGSRSERALPHTELQLGAGLAFWLL